MLAVCKQMGWNTKTYLETDHPIQKLIYTKIKELCETESELSLTADGCGAPNWAASLEELAIGFYNLHKKNPYLRAV